MGNEEPSKRDSRWSWTGTEIGAEQVDEEGCCGMVSNSNKGTKLK